MVDGAAANRMRLRMRVHHLPGRHSLRRVLTPAVPLARTHVTNLLWQKSGALIGSRADLLRLGALFRVAAVSSHSLVFLPLRRNARSEAVTYWAADQGLADLVIARSETALRPSAWPGLRAQLRHDSLTTMRAPAARPESGESPLRVAEHAGTLFLFGSAAALHHAGDELTRCGDQVAVNPDIHRYGGPALLSQFAGPDRHPGRRDGSWHFMILAEDEIFHRARWTKPRGVV